MNTGNRIAQKRKEMDMSKSDLAKKAGLSPTIIGLYESGEREPSFESKLKLCKALGVSFSFFDHITKTDSYDDPLINIMMKGVQRLDTERKKKLFEYYCMLANNQHISYDYLLFDDLNMYIRDLLKNMDISEPPINPEQILKNLNCNLLSVDKLDDYEAILIKDRKSTILYEKKSDIQRLNYTFAHMIAHLVLPWHVSSKFNCRPKDKSSFHEEDALESEAHFFAAALLMPEDHIRSKLQLTSPSFKDLDELANLYNVSRLAMATRYVYLSDGHGTIIRSKDTKVYSSIAHPDFNYNVIQDNMSPQSKAYELFQEKPKTVTSKIGLVPVSIWFKDASTGYLTEESLYNPDYPGEVLTLLHKA